MAASTQTASTLLWRRGVRSTLLATILVIVSCAQHSAPNDNTSCQGGKCDNPNDIPHDPPDVSCSRRRADALSSGQHAYLPDTIRWACADVEGVNTVGHDDRGQEYCEYFALIQLPGESSASDYGHTLSKTAATPLTINLTDTQSTALEDDPTAVVGQCIFTSWHQDVEEELPSCTGGHCADVLGYALTAEHVRMKLTINSNAAANDLLNQCFVSPAGGDPSNAMDPLNDNYTRGCMLDHSIFGTEWRRSDPTVCAAAMRLHECGCSVPGATSIADALIPPQPTSAPVTLRGFPLGGWAGKDQLPAGCRYLDTGDASQVLVSCDLTADDVLQNRTDPKGACRTKYGADIVIQVPIPPSAIVCTPPSGTKYGDGCPAQPWVL
jgi:hypothetical protein